MTEHDRPTTPGTIEAAEAERDDEHDRDTIPAPEPVRAEDSEARASDTTPTPSVPMRLATAEEAASTEIETLRDSEVEVDTVRPPPPPDGVLAGVATSAPRAAAVDQSSIAPRELSKRPAPPPSGQRRVLGLLAAALLFGLGVLASQRADRAPRRTQAAASGAAADSVPPAPAPNAIDPAVPSSEPAIAAPTPSLEPGAAPADATKIAPNEGAQPLALATTAERTPTAVGGIAPALRGGAMSIAGTTRGRAARTGEAQAVPASDLPETPSREAIAAALQDLRGAIELCSDGRSGVAELDLTIRGSGALSHALVGGDFAGTPQGTCIARTLRAARFAPFQKPKFRVLYKLML